MKETGEILVYRDGNLTSAGKGGKKRGRQFVLVPYRALSIRSFDYPFGSISAIREALRLQYVSVASGRDLEIYPVVLKKENRRFSGAALVIPFDERSSVEERIGKGSKTAIWPLPFALASELDGEGGAVCVLDDGISSAFFVDGEPVLYRWQPLSRRTPEQERDWLLSYGSKYRDEPFKTVIVDASQEGERLSKGVRETVEAFPSFGSYSLSRRVLDSAIVLEHVVKGLSALSWSIMIASVVFLSAGLIKSSAMESELDKVKDRSIKAYQDAFGPGNVRDPLSQARGMLAQATNAPDGPRLEDCLRILARAWPDGESDEERISIDTLRFSVDGMDLIGTANEVGMVQNLQKAIKAETDGSVKLGDIQQVPGGGLRYSLEVRWASR